MRSSSIKTKTIKIEQNELPVFWLLESTVFKSVRKAVYSVQNKPLSEFKNWWVTTPLQGYIYTCISNLNTEKYKWEFGNKIMLSFQLLLWK